MLFDFCAGLIILRVVIIIKVWMEVKAKSIMDEAGAFAGKKNLAEDLRHFKLSQACIGFSSSSFSFLHLLSAFFLIFILFTDIQFKTKVWHIEFDLPLSAGICYRLQNVPAGSQ